MKLRCSELDRVMACGRSSRYRTRYRVGTLRGRPVYWHPGEEGFSIEMDGQSLVRIEDTEHGGISFNAPRASNDGIYRLIEDAEENPRLYDAMPCALRDHVDSYTDHE